MEDGKFKNSYLGGLDQDTTPENYKSNRIFDAFNMRLSLDEKSNYFGRLINEKGTYFGSYVGGFVLAETKSDANPTSGGTFRLRLTINSVDTTIFPLLTADDYNISEPTETIRFITDVLDQNATQYGYAVFGNRINIWSKLGDENVSAISINHNIDGLQDLFTGYIGHDNHVIIGGNSIRDSIVLFTTHKDNDMLSPDGTDGAIWELAFDPSTKTIGEKNLRFFSEEANFSTANPIKAIGIQENDNIKKEYWIDGYNNLRYINLLAPNSVFTLASNLELSPNIDFKKISLDLVNTSGNFLSGSVQYAYQLYNKNGNQSGLSPLSDLFSIKDGQNLGGKENETVNCSFKVKIEGLDRKFTSLKIYRFHNTIKGVNPEVTIIIDDNFGAGNESGEFLNYSFLDDGGNGLASISLDEVLLLGSENIKPEDIGAKHNMLFAANIKTDDFDVDYDARAYSFDIDSNVLELYSSENELTSEIISVLSDFDNIGETHDAINPEFWDSTNGIEEKGQFKVYYNSYNETGVPTPSNYKFYKLSSSIFGGTGKNISYEITTSTIEGEDMAIDNIGVPILPSGTDIVRQFDGPANGDKNFMNPYYMDWRGYQRGEIYRFGIVFINKEGKESFAKWIADIKIPEHSMHLSSLKLADSNDVKMYYKPTSGVDEDIVKINPMWVKFDVNITQELIDSGVVSYKIVRLEREEIDKTIISQGFIEESQKLSYPLDAAVTNTYDYECTINGLRQSLQGSFISLGDLSLNTTQLENGFNYGLNGNQLYNVSNWEWYNPDGSSTQYDSLWWSRTSWADARVGLSTDQILERSLSILKFNSPDESFDKDMSFENGNWLDVIGSSRTGFMDIIPENYGSVMWKFADFRLAYKRNSLNPVYAGTQEDKIYEMKKLSSPLEAADATAESVTINSNEVFRNYIYDQQQHWDGSAPDPGYWFTKGGYGSSGLVLNLKAPINMIHGFAWEKNGGDDEAGDNGLIPLTEDWTELTADARYTSDPGLPIANIRRKLNTQYGGIDYSFRQRNTYIQSSEVIDFTLAGATQVVAKKGDTMISHYRCLRKMRGEGDRLYSGSGVDTIRGFGNSEYVAIPMEVNINIDAKWNKDPWDDTLVGHLRETRLQTDANRVIIAGNNGGYTATAADVDDQYQLNGAYNKENTTVYSSAKPPSFVAINERDVETRFSDVKRYNELIDSWTIFRANNVNNVDARFGAIKGLQFFNNQLYYFQENGFGIWQINQQAMISAQDGAQIQLGVGDVLARFDYVSKVNGAMSKFSIASGDSSLMFYDQRRNKLIRVAKGMNEVSVTKGMNSKFEQLFLNTNSRNEYQNPLSDEGVLIYYDETEKEFLITVKVYDGSTSPGINIPKSPLIEATSKNTFTYMENLDAFGPRQGYTPGLYINVAGVTLATDEEYGSINIHKRLPNNRASYYGADPQQSSVTLILNPQPGMGHIFIFDTISYLLNVDSWSSTTQEYEAINDLTGLSTLRVWNNYQDSGVINLKTAGAERIRKKLGKWRATIPRNEDTLQRMRDSHMFLELTYDNEVGSDGNNRIALSDIFSNVRLSQI